MFLVNSRLGHFSAAPSGFDTLLAAVLLPKLRTHFAEFLNWGSLARLRIFTWPTCVGLGTDDDCAPRGSFLDDDNQPQTLNQRGAASHYRVIPRFNAQPSVAEY